MPLLDSIPFDSIPFDLQLTDETRRALIVLAARLGLLMLCVVAALVAGRLVPWLLRLVLGRVATSKKRAGEYATVAEAIARPLSIATALVLISVSLNLIRTYSGLHSVVSFFVDGAVAVALAWTATRLSSFLRCIFICGGS
ncbi:MAG: hypothetical protein AAF289_06665 [Cyanobacteria bacterium P01_A01_bin.135]